MLQSNSATMTERELLADWLGQDYGLCLLAHVGSLPLSFRAGPRQRT